MILELAVLKQSGNNSPIPIKTFLFTIYKVENSSLKIFAG